MEDRVKSHFIGYPKHRVKINYAQTILFIVTHAANYKLMCFNEKIWDFIGSKSNLAEMKTLFTANYFA